LRRFRLLQRVLAQMGIEPERLKLVWASAAEGAILADEVNKFVEEVRALGPLHWHDNIADVAPHLSSLEVTEEVAHGR
jgi:F420-non-reducing hydrogenase iron-sulfur subunit